MQAKDIPDALILAIVRDLGWPKRAEHPYRDLWWAMIWDIAETLETHIPGVPDKVLQAKLRRLYARKLLTGCPCGCRGDWSVTEAGEGVADSVKPLPVRRRYTPTGEVAERVS